MRLTALPGSSPPVPDHPSESPFAIQIAHPRSPMVPAGPFPSPGIRYQSGISRAAERSESSNHDAAEDDAQVDQRRHRFRPIHVRPSSIERRLSALRDGTNVLCVRRVKQADKSLLDLQECRSQVANRFCLEYSATRWHRQGRLEKRELSSGDSRQPMLEDEADFRHR